MHLSKLVYEYMYDMLKVHIVEVYTVQLWSLNLSTTTQREIIP